MDLTTPPEGYTEEEWTDLSDSEKEGILDGLKNPEGQTEANGDPSEDDLKKIIGDEKQDKTEQEAAKEAGDGDVGATPEPESHSEAPTEKKEVVPEVVPDDELARYRPVVTDADLKFEEVTPPELEAQLNDLKAKYDDGDITIHEYNDQRDAINRKVYKHNADLEAAARSEAAWSKEQLFFLKNRPEYLAGQQADATGKIRANALFGALSETVKALSGDEANANLSGMQLLVKADGIVKEAFGMRQKPDEKPVPKKDVEKKPPAALPEHQTLSGVPASGKNDVADDAFSQLDKLSGEAYEEALERLPPNIRDAYLNRT